MTRSPIRRLVFGTLRRLLYLWVRSETINQSSFTLDLDRSRPVFYVLQNPSPVSYTHLTLPTNREV